MFPGFEKYKLSSMVNIDHTMKHHFLEVLGNKVKTEDFEALKEDNIDIVIDMYG